MVNRSDTQPGPATVSTRLDERDSLPHTIVRAVAALEDKRPTDLPPLAESVDPDSLVALADTNADQLRISFTYCEHDIVVTPDHLTVY